MNLSEIELWKRENEKWKINNEELFGVTPLTDGVSFTEMQEELDKSTQYFWNGEGKRSILAEEILSGRACKDIDKMIENSFNLTINSISQCIDIKADFMVKGKQTECKIASIPTPIYGLVWIINGTRYTPRIISSRRNPSVYKNNTDENIVTGEGWIYNIYEDKFDIRLTNLKESDIFKNLRKNNRLLLSKFVEGELTEENFKEALKRLPAFPSNSIFNYDFYHLDYYKDMIKNNTNYANPVNGGAILGINQKIQQTKTQRDGSMGQLVISTGPLFSLENFRIVVNKYETDDPNGFVPAFSYDDTTGFFDPYKTSTSGSAGRQRMLLDDIEIKDGLMMKDGRDMFDFIEDRPKGELSVVSKSPFCLNNKSKRIMMTSKISAQAVNTADETDGFTHRTRARVCLADLKGYTYNDSIVISESFAERLKTTERAKVVLETNSKEMEIVNERFDNDETLSLQDLSLLYPNRAYPILDKYKNTKVVDIEKFGKRRSVVTIQYELPFGLGDKLSNLHGAKGVVGLILPDEKMPILENKVGNMEPGPVEIVISSFSTIKRGSLGQIFESWLHATDTKVNDGDDLVGITTMKESKSMKEFGSKSLVTFEGSSRIKPVGMMDIIRLHHHSSTKVSESPLKPFIVKSLHFGEMEKLNLVAMGCPNILKEISLRSTQKHLGAYRASLAIQETHKLPEKMELSLKFARLLKSMGYSIKIDGKEMVESDKRVLNIDLEDELLLNENIKQNGDV